MDTPQHFPKLGVSACVWQGERALLIQRGKEPMIGAWSLPGGRVEAGETTLEAAHRELMEETGITARLDHLVGIFDAIQRDAQGGVIYHYSIACYTGPWLSGEARPLTDAKSTRWTGPDELDGLSFVPNVRDAIARAASMIHFNPAH